MLVFFFSIVTAIFKGEWYSYDLFEMTFLIKQPLNKIVEVATSLFNNVDTPVTNVDALTEIFQGAPYYMYLVSAIIALVVTIALIITFVKIFKHIFEAFYTGFRRR